MNIGKRIRDLRQARNMTITDLAAAIGSDAGNISRLETGKQKSFTEASLAKIAQALAVPVYDLFAQAEPGFAVQKHSEADSAEMEAEEGYRVDILDVSASAGEGYVNSSDIVETIHAIVYNSEHALALFGGRPESAIKVINVRGDSMSGTLEPGDLLFVDVTVRQLESDGIYVFGFDEKIHVKRLQLVPDRILVLSDNPKYREWAIDKSNESRFRIFGRVLISQSQEFRRHG
ncbi:XRE family transcriptional regulator [Dryocola clanedunensis]|uniref:XRE family transcriptional regulator n=1 Tax=Cedecea sulfonylureivorans TaxID=3051154 RepID=UPI001925BD50|nr:helix-turn-helix transcriptional regulator [Cedecea sulfonylureivorans]